MTSKIPRDLAALGFEAAIRATPKTLFMTLGGKEKSGKTDWTIRNVPDPIGFVDVDKRAAQILNKFREAKDIWPIRISVPKEQGPATAEFLKFEKAWYAFLHNKDAAGGTLVVDTFTEIWELGRIAEFGPTAAAKAHHYRGLNARFNEMLDAIRESDKNAILIYKLVEAWDADKPTGEFRFAGFKNALFKSDINATIDFDDEEKQFELKIERCGLKYSLNGAELAGPECSFAVLASKIYKGTKPEEWGQL